MSRVQLPLRDRRRRFKCCGCGRRIAPDKLVALVGIAVLRRRPVPAYRRGLAGTPAVELVPVVATDRYPARACRRCAAAWPERVKPAPAPADATVTG